MKQSLINKLENLVERCEEVSALLGTTEIINDQKKFRTLAKEHAELTPVVDCFGQYQALMASITDIKDLLRDEEDAQLHALAEEELAAAEERRVTLELALQRLLLPKDPTDSNNLFLEIRAGAGGDESALLLAT